MKSTVPSVGAAGVDVRQRLVFSGIVCRLPCHGLRDLSGADAPRRSPLGQGLRCRRPRGCQCSCSGRLGSRRWAGSHAARGARRPAPASRGRCRLRTGGMHEPVVGPRRHQQGMVDLGAFDVSRQRVFCCVLSSDPQLGAPLEPWRRAFLGWQAAWLFRTAAYLPWTLFACHPLPLRWLFVSAWQTPCIGSCPLKVVFLQIAYLTRKASV